MSISLRKYAAGIAAAGLVLGASIAVAATASATTLTCTNTLSATQAPFGCGGLQIASGYKFGSLDLSTNGVVADSAPVVVEPDSVSSNNEDFTVFALDGLETGGPGDLGQYVAEVTPDAKIAYFTPVTVPAGCAQVHGTVYKNAVPCAGETFNQGPGDYCLSVANFVGPNGKLRWWVLDRLCDTSGTFTYGTATTPGTVPGSHANKWQVWAPVTGVSGLKMVNVSLRNKFNSDYDLNVTGAGGANSSVQAYQDNTGGVSNDQWTVIGCTPPITLLNTSYWACWLSRNGPGRDIDRPGRASPHRRCGYEDGTAAWSEGGRTRCARGRRGLRLGDAVPVVRLRKDAA